MEFPGFGSLVNQKMEFSRNKLNLVLEPNESGKSTIAESIWAVLFDYPPYSKNTAEKMKERDARQPAQGGPFKVAMDISLGARSLKIVRDFGMRSLRVFDRNKGDLDVSADFLSGPTQDDVGFKLTGMNRDLFKSTCFVGQKELDRNSLDEAEGLCSLLQSLADSSGAATTSATAVSVLDTALSHFPYQGIKLRVDKLLQQLEDERDRLQALIENLEAERASVESEFQDLNRVESALNAAEQANMATDYFQLCMDAAETDTRLMKAQERLLRVNDLKTQLAKLAEYRDFPSDRARAVEELWTRRQSRLADHKRTDLELKLKEKQLQARELEIREKWDAVSTATVEDAQNLASLARTLQEIRTELAESKRKRDDEAVRVKECGVELDKLSGVRTALLNLDARDLDNAQAYNAMINAARDQIKECEGTVWRAMQILPEIEEQRKLKAGTWRNNLTLAGAFAAVSGGVVAFLLIAQHQPVHSMIVWPCLVLCLGLCGAAIFCVTQLGQAKAYREKDFLQANEDKQKFGEKGTELHNKVMGLEVKLEDLARKACVSSGAELLKHLQTYGTSSMQLKDLDLLDQVIDSREAHLVKLVAQLEPYFNKCRRKVPEITPDAALKLSEDINQFLEESRTVKTSSGSLDHHQSQLKFLTDELKDIDAHLKEHFSLAKVEHPDDPESGYQEFVRALAGHRQWESVKSELDRMDQDTTTDLPASELPAIIQRLESTRTGLWSRIESLIAENPDIASQSPPMVADGSIGQKAATEGSLSELRKERDQLLVQIRSATKNYDEKYLGTLEDFEEIEREIVRVRSAKTALELARDTFQRLSEETHSNWSGRLNEISREMLQSLNTEFESLNFSPDLRLTARRKGQSEPLQTANINSQTSGGAREQLHWLARMAVARYLAEQTALPIILDEPFAESDDERFLSMMRFLLGTIVGQHQIILFSCHQRRHEWLLDQLNENERLLINQCRLDPLAAMSDAAM